VHNGRYQRCISRTLHVHLKYLLYSTAQGIRGVVPELSSYAMEQMYHHLSQMQSHRHDLSSLSYSHVVIMLCLLYTSSHDIRWARCDPLPAPSTSAHVYSTRSRWVQIANVIGVGESECDFTHSSQAELYNNNPIHANAVSQTKTLYTHPFNVPAATTTTSPQTTTQYPPPIYATQTKHNAALTTPHHNQSHVPRTTPITQWLSNKTTQSS
jgi:hypothetical protein